MLSGPAKLSSENAALQELLQALGDRGYQFVTITPATHEIVNGRPENAHARSLTDVFGWSRPFARDVMEPAIFEIALAAGVLRQENQARWRSLVRVSTLDAMLFVHAAFPTDIADAVFFGPDTYRFAEAIRGYLRVTPAPVRRALDIGCGSGAGGLVVAKLYPAADVLMTDVNGAALAAAAVNAAAARAANVKFHLGDLFDGIDGRFDLIVANPPYLVDVAERHYRHGGGPWGAALSLRIAQEALAHLNPGGRLVLYTGSAIVNGRDLLHGALGEILAGAQADWLYREIDPDVFGEELREGVYAKVDRIAAVVLTVEVRP